MYYVSKFMVSFLHVLTNLILSLYKVCITVHPVFSLELKCREVK